MSASARSIRARAKKRGPRVTVELRLPDSLARVFASMTTIEREHFVVAALLKAARGLS